MKKLNYFVVAIFTILVTAACSEKEFSPTHKPELEGQVIKARIHGGIAETKTGVEYDAELKAYFPYWNEGDQISVFFDEFEGKDKVDASLANTKGQGDVADFSSDDVTVRSGTTLKEDGIIYSFYPKSAFHAVVSDKCVRLNLITNQEPAAVYTFDPAADILVGQPSEYLYDGDYLTADIAFARIMSVVKVTLKATNDCPENIAINKFTMTAPDGTVLTGRSTVSLAALYGDDNPIKDWTVKTKEVSALYKDDFHPVIGGSENTIYVIVNPTTIESGSEVTFTMESNDYNISKTVTLSKALSFPQGNVANINLTIANDNCKPVVAEKRIYVESFSDVTTSAKQVQPSGTGAKGTGLNRNTAYDFGSDSNTNIRFNSNGHSSSDPYLFLRSNATFVISNISVSEVSSLQFMAQTKNVGSVILRYKESSSEDWNTVDTWTTAASFGEQSSVFAISNSATSLDFSFTAGDAAVIIDDIVIDRYMDRHVKLDTPENLVAEIDENVPNKVNISWDAVENASAYEVVLSADGQDEISKTPEHNELVVANLSYNTTYSVKVRATTTDTEKYYDSEYSFPIEITTGEKPAGTVEWVATAFGDLKAGDQVVIVRTSGDAKALSNNNGTNSAPTAVGVTISSGKLSAAPDATLIWYVAVDGDNKIFNADKEGTKWLYCTNTNNGVRVGENTNKSFTLDGEYLKHNGTGRYVGVYNDADWRCYISKTTNIGNQTFSFFVKIGGSSPVEPVKLANVQGLACSAHSVTSLSFTWDAVEHASGYKVSIDGGNTYGETQVGTSYVWSGLTGNTEYVIFVKAVGDGVNYTDSDAAHISQSTDSETSEPVVLRFTSVSDVESGVYTASVAKGNGASNPAWTSNELRMYANNTLTISTTGSDMTKVEVLYHKQGSKDYATASANVGTYTSGGVSTSSNDPKTDTWTGSAKSVTITLGTSGQRVVESIKIY